MYNRKEGWNQVCFISIRQSIVNLVYLDKAKNASTKALKTTYISNAFQYQCFIKASIC